MSCDYSKTLLELLNTPLPDYQIPKCDQPNPLLVLFQEAVNTANTPEQETGHVGFIQRLTLKPDDQVYTYADIHGDAETLQQIILDLQKGGVLDLIVTHKS